MRKEIVIAIVVGFVLGLIITFGIYTANRAVKEQDPSNNHIPNNTTPPSPLASPSLSLEITEPEDNLVIAKNKTTVSGKTIAKATVAILAENYENLLLADEEGIFSDEVPLTSGANEIKVISSNKNGEKEEKVITVVYTTAKIE